MASQKTSIRSLLAITGVVALWFLFYDVNANLSLMFCAWFAALAISLYMRSDRPFFWLPFLCSINYSFLSMMLWWSVPHGAIFLGYAGTTFLVAVFIFTKNRTLQTYHKRDNRDGVLLTTIGNAGLGGVYAGMMIAAPYFASLLISYLWNNLNVFSIDFTGLISLPIAGGLLGLFLGIGFGFIFDIMIALESRNRIRNANHGITKR